MLPTLNGRIQTRIFLLARGRRASGRCSSRRSCPRRVARDAYKTTFIVLATVAVLGIGWELIYHLIQQFRWEKDWPTLFGCSPCINEGAAGLVAARRRRDPVDRRRSRCSRLRDPLHHDLAGGLARWSTARCGCRSSTGGSSAEGSSDDDVAPSSATTSAAVRPGRRRRRTGRRPRRPDARHPARRRRRGVDAPAPVRAPRSAAGVPRRCRSPAHARCRTAASASWSTCAAGCPRAGSRAPGRRLHDELRGWLPSVERPAARSPWPRPPRRASRSRWSATAAAEVPDLGLRLTPADGERAARRHRRSSTGSSTGRRPRCGCRPGR